MSFWNSLESLNRISSFLILLWIIVPAILGIFSWKIQSRISELNVANEKELQTKVETTGSKAVELEKQLAQSETLRVEKDKLLKAEIEKTNKRIEPRDIPPDLFSEGVALLSTLPSRNFIIKVMSEDFEGQDLAPKFAGLLSAAGWKFSGIQPHGQWRFDDGIKINMQSQTKEIGALSQLLVKYDFAPHIEEYAKDDFVRIFIGKLPK